MGPVDMVDRAAQLHGIPTQTRCSTYIIILLRWMMMDVSARPRKALSGNAKLTSLVVHSVRRVNFGVGMSLAPFSRFCVGFCSCSFWLRSCLVFGPNSHINDPPRRETPTKGFWSRYVLFSFPSSSGSLGRLPMLIHTHTHIRHKEKDMCMIG